MDIEIIAENILFPEAPVVCDDGSIIVGELRTGNIVRIRKDGHKHNIACVDGAPNGLAFGPDGALYCCNNGGFRWAAYNGPETALPLGPAEGYTTGSIDRIDLSTGRVERLFESCDGLNLAGPNDLVFDRDGGFWFSDFGKDLGDRELVGGLYHARADGSSIRRIAYGFGANGVGLSPDGATVYTALTLARHILAFPTAGERTPPVEHIGIRAEQGYGIGAGRLVTSFPGRQLLDSMAIETDGTIAQAVLFQDPGIGRVNPATGSIVMVPFPDLLTTNIAFGGADMQTAYVTLTATNRIARVRWPAPGLRLAFNG